MVIGNERQWSGRFTETAQLLLTRLSPGSVAAFLLPFLLYLHTLAPSFYNLDSAELTVAVATRGILRATGYPLYLVLGRLWTQLPLGDYGFRMNLFSAFAGAMTVLLVDRILRRLDVGPWARLGALGLLATAPYFWSLSLIAEVYTLHTMLMAGLILALLRWAESPSPLRLGLAVFIISLSLGNHVATVLLVPGCLWYVVTNQPKALLQWRTWLCGIIALLAGASVFLYLPIAYTANPAFNYAGTYDSNGVFHPVNLQTLEGVAWLVTGRTFAGQMFGYRLGELWSEVANYSLQLWGAFLAVGVGPGIVGIVVLTRRNWRLGGMLLLMFTANAVFYMNYRVVDKNTMYLPTYLVWSIWLAVGYQALLHQLAGLRLNWQRDSGSRSPFNGPDVALWAVRSVMVGAVVAALFWNWARVDLSNDWSTREQSEEILAQVEPDAIVLGWWDTVPGLQYLQLVEGKRPDLTLINRFLIDGDDMMALIKNRAGDQPIYINNPPLDLIQTMKVSWTGHVYRLEPRQ